MSDKKARLESLLTRHYHVTDALSKAEQMRKRLNDGACQHVQCTAVPGVEKPEKYTDQEWENVTQQMAFIQVDGAELGQIVLSQIESLHQELYTLDKQIESINI